MPGCKGKISMMIGNMHCEGACDVWLYQHVTYRWNSTAGSIHKVFICTTSCADRQRRLLQFSRIMRVARRRRGQQQVSQYDLHGRYMADSG